VVSRQFKSVDNWDRATSGTWTGGQASGLNPGSKKATTKRRQTTSHARTKKVIRPRIKKHQLPSEGDGR